MIYELEWITDWWLEMTQEKPKILVRTRLTQTDELKFRELTKAQSTITYKLVRQFIYAYLQQNSQAV